MVCQAPYSGASVYGMLSTIIGGKRWCTLHHPLGEMTMVYPAPYFVENDHGGLVTIFEAK